MTPSDVSENPDPRLIKEPDPLPSLDVLDLCSSPAF